MDIENQEEVINPIFNTLETSERKVKKPNFLVTILRNISFCLLSLATIFGVGFLIMYLSYPDILKYLTTDKLAMIIIPIMCFFSGYYIIIFSLLIIQRLFCYDWENEI